MNRPNGLSQDPAQPGWTNLMYELPPVVRSIRDSFQMTFQSAAVVSGLLAGVASQLYGFFKSPDSYSEATGQTSKDAIVALCYLAMFLNIGATLSGFMIIDALGEVQYRAATRPMGQDHDDVSNGDTRSSEKEIPQLLESYSRGWNVNMLVQHWFFSFCGGILSLLILIVLYVAIEERVALRVLAAILLFYALLPALSWFWPSFRRSPSLRRSHSRSRGNTSKPVAHPQNPASTNGLEDANNMAPLPTSLLPA
ncbi:hypothetical protein FA13DRAFT_1797294 [Coprinellus micaceus]|uniref:Uncharacterized protein n=1 Tax=Coprinellus micaceus TaxID=71717 RepID=A0A4Y7SS36_COPMI|nr:hypothetical protein FA13DRAFT_1797294 [Coprinellus micaceus]